MIEPFKRANGHGHIIAEANVKADWFFTEPTIARREYDGILMALTPGKKGYEGWQYYQPFEVHYDFPGDPQQVTSHTPSGWHAVYPKLSIYRQTLRALAGKWSERVSPFKHVQVFEDAELMFSVDYPYGEYWLLVNELQLIPVDSAEQISNINDLDLTSGVEEAFADLQKTMFLLKDSVYGVIFTAKDGRKARVRPADFDWDNYDGTI
jgi:hypothetical protein